MSTKIVDHGDIPIDLIVPNPEQPRQEFDEAGLEELAQSIREMGVIQPIVVELSPDPDINHRYILHAGERRLRAAKMAGLEVIPAIVSGESSQTDRLVRALVENVQREDMAPLDVAKAYARMHDELDLTDQQIADRIGKSRSSVANARRLLGLPADVQKLASQEGVSERQLMALLPMYQLPQEALDRAEKTYWAKPDDIVRNIRKGQATSNTVRDGVARVINNSTFSLSDAVFPLEHEFEGDGLRAPRCDQCEACITVGKGKDKRLRCPIKSCFQTKSHRWETEQLQAAIEASGIPALEDGVEYGEIERFSGYDEGRLAQQILSDGCENLRLKFEAQLGSGGLSLPGQHYARVVCHHGKGHKCKCLLKFKRERSRNDPERIAERENQKRLKAEIIEPWAAALAQAIADGQPGVWRRIMRQVSYQLNGKGDDWDLTTIQQKMAEVMVNNSLPWDAYNRLGAALSAIQRSFDEMGIPYPGQSVQDTAADMRGRLDRIRRWVADLEKEAPTIEAVRGNLANLDKLTDEFDEVADQHIDDERLDSFLQDMVDVYERLHELYVLMANPLFRMDDFEHVSWLITVPSSDINFKGHLEQASAAVLRYVLVLVDGRENDKTRAEAIKRQLRKLEANGRIVGVQTVEVEHG
jgi:ParB/RepB/Spo0J family partition protein